MTAREGAGTDGLSGGRLLSGAGWHGVFFLQDHSLCLVPAQSPSQRVTHLLSPDVGCGAYPSGHAGSDSADAGTDCEARRQQFPLLVLSPQMSASRNEFWVVWQSISL